MGAIPVSLRPLVLLTPSQVAADELPRRVVSTGRALAGVYSTRVDRLADKLVKAALLGRGLEPWGKGHDALAAARLLAETGDAGLRFPEGTPRGPVADALARTLAALRRAGIPQERVAAIAGASSATSDDAPRLGALARLYDGYCALVEGSENDRDAWLAAVREGLSRASWLHGAEVLITDDLEFEPDEIELVAAIGERFPVRILRRPLPPSLRTSSYRGRMTSHGVSEVEWVETILAPAAPPSPRHPWRVCARRCSSRRAGQRYRLPMEARRGRTMPPSSL